MTKADIVDRIASATGLTKLETDTVVNAFMLTIIDALKENKAIELRGFGSFRVEKRAPRVARNPRTNQVVPVPERYVPVFRVSDSFRDAVDDAVRSSAS